MQTLSFDEWLKELDVIASREGQQGSMVEQTCRECWQMSYDEGHSPEVAYDESMSYGEPMED